MVMKRKERTGNQDVRGGAEEISGRRDENANVVSLLNIQNRLGTKLISCTPNKLTFNICNVAAPQGG